MDYNELNEKIEKMSELFYTVFVNFSFIAFALSTLSVTAKKLFPFSFGQ